jgi:predicted transcriptional regulator
MPQLEPSDLELQILSLLWANGPMTARQVLEGMPDGKRRAYTSILSAMQVMEKKGLLSHKAAGNMHVYRPKVERGRVLGRMLRRWVDQILGGEPAAAVQLLLQQTPVSAQELAEIRRLVDEHAAKEERP